MFTKLIAYRTVVQLLTHFNDRFLSITIFVYIFTFWIKIMEEKDVTYTEIDTKNSIAVFRLLMAMRGLKNISEDDEVSTLIWDCAFC